MKTSNCQLEIYLEEKKNNPGRPAYVCIFMMAKDLIESRTHDADTARGEYSKHEGGQKTGGAHEDAEESKDKGFPMCAALSAVCIIRRKKKEAPTSCMIVWLSCLLV